MKRNEFSSGAASGREMLAERLSSARVEKVHTLVKYLDSEADGLRRQGLPIGPGMRIDETAFAGSKDFSVEILASDAEYTQKMEAKFHREMSEGEIREQKERDYSDVFEMLMTAVLHRAIGERFAVVRSSRFDDIANGVDNFIVDRTAGTVVGTLDEVGEIRGPAIVKKKREIEHKNHRSGATVRYAFRFRKQDGKVELGTVEHVPMFLLALNKELIHQMLDKCNFAQPEQGEYEKKLVAYVMSQLSSQIKEIELYDDFHELHPEMKRSLVNLKGYLLSNHA